MVVIYFSGKADIPSLFSAHYNCEIEVISIKGKNIA